MTVTKSEAVSMAAGELRNLITLNADRLPDGALSR